MYKYQEPPPSPETGNKTNTMALVSLIAGVLGALTSALSLCIWCFGGIPLILGIVAAVTGYLGKKQIDESGGPQSGGPQSSQKMATAGMILGLVSIVLSIVFIGLGIIFTGFSALSEFI